VKSPGSSATDRLATPRPATRYSIRRDPVSPPVFATIARTSMLWPGLICEGPVKLNTPKFGPSSPWPAATPATPGTRPPTAVALRNSRFDTEYMSRTTGNGRIYTPVIDWCDKFVQKFTKT